MLIKGTIRAVEEPDYTDPQWHNQYQNIVILTAQGDFKGRIGTKKPYTQADIGSEGQWDTEEGNSQQGPYNKLKKHYDQPYGQQAQQQAPQQQAQGQSQQQKPDWDAIALGKVRHGIVCAFIQRGGEQPSTQQIEYWVQYVMTGKPPLPPEGESVKYEVDPNKAPF